MEYHPNQLGFKDGLGIREHVTKKINKVETILKNHHQSDLYTSGDER
jgi:ribosome-associated translation inhibitor RaiA